MTFMLFWLLITALILKNINVILYGSLSENGPKRLIYLSICSQLNSLGRIRNCGFIGIGGLVGRCVSLGWA